jgi:hypothetical protein
VTSFLDLDRERRAESNGLPHGMNGHPAAADRNEELTASICSDMRNLCRLCRGE